MPNPVPAEAAVKTMYRYEVPVDDLPHTLHLGGDPRAVAATRSRLGHVVEFWAEHHDGEWTAPRAFQVYGTGHRIPDSATWRGTAGRVDGLVWHLYELPGEADA